MGAPDFFYKFKGGGGDQRSLRTTALEHPFPSFRHGGRSDKKQCRGAKSGRF